MAMTVMIAHASKDENSRYANGKAGDQTGLEVCIRTWYNRPWNVVLRAKDTKMANKIAEAMEHATKNDHVGYDQNQRNTLLTQVRKLGYDPGRVTVDCETDCSALVSVACMYAGVPESALYQNGNSATTRTLRNRLMKTGLFNEYVVSSYTAGTSKLVRGDILLSEGHHVAVVTRAQPSVPQTSTSKKTIAQVVKEIMQGRYANGTARVAKLHDEGFTDSEIKEIQRQINLLMNK